MLIVCCSRGLMLCEHVWYSVSVSLMSLCLLLCGACAWTLLGRREIAHSIPNIEELDISSNLLSSWEDVAGMVQQLPKLTSLNVSWVLVVARLSINVRFPFILKYLDVKCRCTSKMCLREIICLYFGFMVKCVLTVCACVHGCMRGNVCMHVSTSTVFVTAVNAYQWSMPP